jgi:hypothetical protein
MKNYATRIGVLLAIETEDSVVTSERLEKFLKSIDVDLSVIEYLFELHHLNYVSGLDREEVLVLTLDGKQWLRERLPQNANTSW